MQGGGSPGMTMGDWLVEKGLDAPRSNKPKAASSLAALRHRQVAQARAGHAALQGRPQQHAGRQVGATALCHDGQMALPKGLTQPPMLTWPALLRRERTEVEFDACT